MASRDQQWVDVIRYGSNDENVRRIIHAINKEARTAKRADVIIACAAVLGQSITPSGPDIAGEVRRGIMALIDGYAMEVAISEE